MLAVFLITLANLSERAGWRLFSDADRALVERTRHLQAALINGPVPDSVPIISSHADRICVELRAGADRGPGTYIACYDRRTGEVLEERAIGSDH